jgi:hypothetical protein
VSINIDEIDSVDRFCEDVRALAGRGNLDAALSSVMAFVAGIVEQEATWATVLSSPELDDLCQELGRVSPHLKAGDVDPDATVFVVTAVAGIGGHTRVLMDLVRADPGKNATILVTNVGHSLTEEEVQNTLQRIGSSAKIEVATNLNFAERLRWLQDRLAHLRPARTYILQHQFDAVIAAALQPELVDKVFYFHNCDHNLALGVHIRHFIHVDFNGKGYHQCRTQFGVENNVYWPLVAEAKTHRADKPFMPTGVITTATSGSWPKFDTSYLQAPVPYQYAYADILPSIMRITGGRHYHIGPLREGLAARIQDGLTAAGIDRERFVNIPWVDDVGAELAAKEVDLYIGSFPLAGGKAAIEVMAAGVPLLLHSNYVTPFFTDINEVYPGVLVWRRPGELERVLNNVTPDLLSDHALRARSFYEKYHVPDRLKAAVEDTLNGCPPDAPPPAKHFANTLQRFLDIRAAQRSVPVAAAEAPAPVPVAEPPPAPEPEPAPEPAPAPEPEPAPEAEPVENFAEEVEVPKTLTLSQAFRAAVPMRSRDLIVILWRRLVGIKPT